MIIDGTKDDQILKAIERQLSEASISFERSKLDKYEGIIYKR